MNKDTSSGQYVQRTTLDPDKDTVELKCWIPPIQCEGCESRVNRFYRYERPDDATCTGCGSEWTFERRA